MKNRLSLLPLCLVSLLASLAVLSCDSANPVAPTGSTLTVTANPTLIALNSTSLITVTGFRPDGNPLNPGTLINVSTSIGALDDSVLEIQNGRATTTLRPDGRIGTATVSVSLSTSGGSSGGSGEGGGGSGSSSASVDVQIGQPSDSLPTVTLTATPDILGLGESSEILVQAWNPDGTSYGAGGRIRLTTNLGSLEDEEVVTNASGEVTTLFHAGQTPGTATITGTIGVLGGGGGDGQSSSSTVDVQIGETDATRPTLSLSTSPSAINIETEATITAFARNADGSPLSGGRVVLVTNEGTFSNNSITTTVTTGGNGRATASLSGITSAATVTGSVGSSAEATVDVTFLRTVLDLSVSPEVVDAYSSANGAPMDSNEATVTVQVRDERNALLTKPNTHRVQLTASRGTFVDSGGADLGSSIEVTAVDGFATATYLAGARPGDDSITASIANADSVSETVTIRGVPAVVVLDVSPTSFTPSTDGLDFSISVLVLDAQREPLGNENVIFELSDDVTGVFTPAAGGVLTNNNGRATATLTITDANVPDGVTSFVLTATVGDASDTQRITVNP